MALLLFAWFLAPISGFYDLQPFFPGNCQAHKGITVGRLDLHSLIAASGLAIYTLKCVMMDIVHSLTLASVVIHRPFILLVCCHGHLLRALHAVLMLDLPRLSRVRDPHGTLGAKGPVAPAGLQSLLLDPGVTRQDDVFLLSHRVPQSSSHGDGFPTPRPGWHCRSAPEKSAGQPGA